MHCSYYKYKLTVNKRAVLDQFWVTHGSIKYGPIRFLFFNRTTNHRSLFKNHNSIIYQYLTARATRRSLFNRNVLVADQSLTVIIVAVQSLTAMEPQIGINSNCKLCIVILARNWLIRSYFYRWSGSGIGS